MNKREKELLKHQLTAEEKELRELKKIYQDALKNVNDNIAKLLGRADADMQHVIYRVDYQRALKSQISGILDEMNSKQFESITGYISDSYTNGYVGAFYNMAGQNIPIIAPIDQKQVVKAMRTDSKISKSLYTKLGEDTDELKKRISSTLSRGIAAAQGYNEIARNIAADNNVGYNKAVRIARTEGARVYNAASFDACTEAKKRGADVVKQWNSTLDGSTRPSHGRIDGEIRDLDEKFSNGLMYPSDPSGRAGDVINCRCVLLQRAKWGLDEEELETLKERAAYFGLDKTENFDDYKAKYLVAEKALDNAGKNSTINTKTISEQYKYTEPLNEHDFYSEEQEAFRLGAIKELSNFNDEKAQEALAALCGTRKEYLKNSVAGKLGTDTGWFAGGDSAIRTLATPEAEKKAKTIHDYIMASPKYGGTIYRGLALTQEEVETFKTSGIFNDNGALASWSTEHDVAKVFAEARAEQYNKKPVIFEMDGTSYGTPVAHLSIYGVEENEVLVSNTLSNKWDIIDVSEKGGIPIIKLKEKKL